MSTEQQIIHGTVKWFSNKKGFGFITPAEGSPIDTDVFVHQSSILSEGYRTLDEGWSVEFSVGDDDGGRVKAENVTGPGGGPCTGPHRRRHRHLDNVEEGDHTQNNGDRRHSRGRGRAQKQPEAHWHSYLTEDVKKSLEAKNIRATTGTIDISVGPARVKLGTGGYSSIAHADGILGEGTFTCDSEGNASMQWTKCIAFNGEWKPVENDSRLNTSLSLSSDTVTAVQPDETAATLWGDVPTDPRDALETNEFLMRRVVLSPKKRGGR